MHVSKFAIIIVHVLFVSIDKGESKVDYDQPVEMSHQVADG